MKDNKKKLTVKNEISMVIFVMFFGVLVINNFLVLSLIVKKKMLQSFYLLLHLIITNRDCQIDSLQRERTK